VDQLEEPRQMNDQFLKLYEAAKALITYIDKEDVFDRAAAGGCSGLDFHQSDTFYDLLVKTRKTIGEVENGAQSEASSVDGDRKIQVRDGYSRLFEAVKALATYVDQERVFDKVSDLGPVGFETYQSDSFSKVIKNSNEAIKEVESGSL
jgi:hypothetical protein